MLWSGYLVCSFLLVVELFLHGPAERELVDGLTRTEHGLQQARRGQHLLHALDVVARTALVELVEHDLHDCLIGQRPLLVLADPAATRLEVEVGEEVQRRALTQVLAHLDQRVLRRHLREHNYSRDDRVTSNGTVNSP